MGSVILGFLPSFFLVINLLQYVRLASSVQSSYGMQNVSKFRLRAHTLKGREKLALLEVTQFSHLLPVLY